MLFNSYEFIFVFLPITLIGIYFLAKFKTKKIIISWLAGMSLVFYAWWTPAFLVLLILSICFNYGIGYLLVRLRARKKGFFRPIHVLWFGICLNLLVLAYYKYFNFFLANLNAGFGLSFPLEKIVLPIGISFFTFTQIAFLVDVYRGIVEEYRFISYVLFVTFFPHLIAGPILHHKEMMPQFEDEKTLNLCWKNMTVGMVVFIFGLFKKVIIADNLARFASPIFNAVAQGAIPQFFEAWLGALAYTLQLYFDFSGYSDMAIGLALLCNIRLPINFFSPYKALSIIEFWRRWHMTLSRYLRDYLYIPLGGNRHGEYAKMRNLMITMFLGGLWHGAGWTFVVWGVLHGLYLVVNHMWRRCKIELPMLLSWGITFICVVIAWVFFRADTLHSGWVIVSGMFGGNGISLPENLAGKLHFLLNYGVSFSGIMVIADVVPNKIIMWVAIAFILSVAGPNVMELMRTYKPALGLENKKDISLKKTLEWKPSLIWSILLGVMAIVSILSLINASEFLYFQF